ncbi:N-acetylglucosamine kinase [Ponticoccus sp. SC2-23]|nr:N-acetylglucosamine kinase [Ponticoccus sp. SC6-9]MBM1224327.1 N-acetylglucosamine kinase [Ponticoccus sp. SC6-15]MBM1229894.1 N-acetylglucosamine kinase [Ponticoccus sp. SC6-38]MBM1233293.1 N-acetylglucosamine kinase [Ponticoccus sp. SC6-45]MBM1236757.1 N-acetylglucosamine kinase [Ponticoccus sp. SC6-49]MBM1242304.1 N-acetylglucosamine kinase [Ponticoccus sp. SC2-64]MBM1246817.1 N-acetylglucosamine kinase [Ponticoccus sp. SC6-42]MBM1251295.1 N-acetylglucosamine kinase [Ponticoccus sp. SC
MDIGGTASRWVVVDAAGKMIDRGLCDGASGLIYDARSLARFRGAMEAVRDALPGPVSFAEFGITGAGFSHHPQIEAQVTEILGLPPERFSYASDTSLAWQAVFSGRRGHLVSAGTGSVGMSYDQNHEQVVVGGRGILVDDAGSGVWIALQALNLLFRKIDEGEGPKGAEILASAVFAALGGNTHDAMRNYVYGGDRGQIGRLAVAVAEAAREGDAIAQDLLRRAGRELARLGKTMLKRCGPAPVAFVGGVLALDPVIRAEILSELEGCEVEFPRVDAAFQAAQIAREKDKVAHDTH